MRRTAIVAGAIVVFVVAGVTWSLAAHHGSPVPSITGVEKVLQGIDNLPKALPKVGKCLQGSDPSNIAKCVGKRLPAIPDIGQLPGIGTGGGGSGFDHLAPASTPGFLALGGTHGLDH